MVVSGDMDIKWHFFSISLKLASLFIIPKPPCRSIDGPLQLCLLRLTLESIGSPKSWWEALSTCWTWQHYIWLITIFACPVWAFLLSFFPASLSKLLTLEITHPSNNFMPFKQYFEKHMQSKKYTFHSFLLQVEKLPLFLFTIKNPILSSSGAKCYFPF